MLILESWAHRDIDGGGGCSGWVSDSFGERGEGMGESLLLKKESKQARR